ncbi:ribonuclease E/G [Roseomonas marmotae]|uniref:Ribonuclease E/G n=1 Tax=Roseomonas marmotae TaxID=2768161 RepID=A0ABS3KEV2_9PROT|nr:ribonuclease E/G [Roseomonas marmotae]MBO1074886.1 ribonuclease E/G [Roseomonas marmotae]QTI80612.1 ribonuclease E/G [Roseomonas marmotae]
MTGPVLIFVSTSPGEQRTALLRNDRLEAAFIERPARPDGIGDLHVGRLAARAPAMAGAFVALAGGETGFLPDSEGARGRTEGEWLRVAITRAAQGGKGPRLALRPPPEPVTGPLRLLARGPDAPLRLAAQYPDAPLRADSAATVARLRAALGAARVTLSPTPAFDDALEGEFEELSGPDVALPGGGRLRIHPTPALVAIDVDAGTQAGSRDAGAHLALNRAALAEVARQIRLRHLAGAILVDMAGLPMARRKALLPAMQEAAGADPDLRVVGVTGLGLIELQRRRVLPPLHEVLGHPPSALTRGLAALRRGLRQAAARPGARLVLTAQPAICAALRDWPGALQDFATQAGPLSLRPDPLCPPGQEDIHAE